MKIEIVPFEPWHALSIRANLPWLDFGIDPELYVKMLDHPGYSFSGIKGGIVYGCAGILPLHPGVGQAWMMLTWRAIRSPVALYRAVKRLLPEIQERGRFHRIQAHVLENREDHMEFAERFGFEFEGPKRQFDSARRDYWEFVRLYKVNPENT